MSVRERVRGYRFPATRGETAATVLKFAACSIPLTIAWLYVLTTISGSSGTEVAAETPPLQWVFVGAYLISAVPATLSHLHLSGDAGGVLHRAGELAALYIPVNITVSVWMVAFQHYQVGVIGRTMNGTAITVAETWIFSTLFVPGPFIAALIASWWSR